MPEYSGIIKQGRLIVAEAERYAKWLQKHEGHGVSFTVEQEGKSPDPKTAEQLGYYFGLLRPAIVEQMRHDGQTFEVTAGPYTREIPVNKETVHEWLTALCGFVNDDGTHLRLSECDLVHCIKFIDNVIAFAVDTLGMNEEALKAIRPRSMSKEQK